MEGDLRRRPSAGSGSAQKRGGARVRPAARPALPPYYHNNAEVRPASLDLGRSWSEGISSGPASFLHRPWLLIMSLHLIHCDFVLKAKFRAPMAVYCGSVPKLKPGCRSLRNGSIDSNLQLCGSRWASDKASFQSALSMQMKKSCPWGGNGDQLYPGTVSPSEGCQSRNGHQDPESRRDFPQPPSPALGRMEPEVGSAVLETARLKDKMKRKISEGFGSQTTLSESSSSDGVTLKPAVPRSASQRLLNAPKPMPPIQRSPTPGPAGSTENKQRPSEERGHHPQSVEQTPAPKEVQKSLQYVRYSAEKKRKSLSGALIPPIPNSVRSSPDASPEDTLLGLHLSSQRDEQPAPPLRGPPYARTATDGDVAERTLEYLEIRALGRGSPTTTAKLIENAPQSIPLKTIFLNPSKEQDQILHQQLLNEEDGKENNGRINVTISKSAQDKMRQKQMEEIELRRQMKEKEWSQQQFRTLKSLDFKGISQENLADTGPFSLNGVIQVPVSMKDPHRTTGSVTLRKRVDRPSLPSIPVMSQDISNCRHSSANSLPVNLLDSPDYDDSSESGDSLEMRPFSHPEQGLIDALKCLHNKDWEQKEKGLHSVRRLAVYHSDVLLCRLHDVSLAVTREVSNLRSKVSRHAIRSLGELFLAMKKNMDQEVEEVTRMLLHKTGDSNEFIREESDRSLGIMVENVSPSKALSALTGGVSHRNSSVRRCSAEHLLYVVEQLGADKLLAGTKDNTELLLRMMVKLTQDGHQDTRFYGRKMLNVLMCHPKFEVYMERSVPSHDLRDIMATIKQKGTCDSISEPPSAKTRRPHRSSSIAASRDSLLSDEGADSEVSSQSFPAARHQSIRTAEVTEQIKELSKLLTAKHFQDKMDGVTLLLEQCRSNPWFVASNIIQIFDSFTPRLQDSNKKVNQYALESMAVMIPLLKDSLHHVLISLVTPVTDKLNCKNPDNVWLLQPFASRVKFLSGRAVNDITERLSVMVASVYPRKPQAVERHVLPTLWYFLNNMTGNGVLVSRSGNVKAVVCMLIKSLHKQMGPSLEEYASSQPQHVSKTLRDLMDMEHP
ncbi:TOG array regulator of axonemal microtubules protein 2 isoform X3 [Rhinatrema bivittatum]|uniref:TOG array regulator of axonemal microtubules protein 2 isoform X3 n=1 Tax=Rhinatrema bivittatum TaxID=194408 RepID=UPI00112666B2|nr:TOG array regulator of axonemal microtubules protein 2 isoform X3 [Rhinatrema bivittatum]